MEGEADPQEVSLVTHFGAHFPWDFWFREANLSSSHLDAVRAIAFHPTELCLASAGDDSTVKVWRVDLASLTAPACVPLCVAPHLPS